MKSRKLIVPYFGELPGEFHCTARLPGQIPGDENRRKFVNQNFPRELSVHIGIQGKWQQNLQIGENVNLPQMSRIIGGSRISKYFDRKEVGRAIAEAYNEYLESLIKLGDVHRYVATASFDWKNRVWMPVELCPFKRIPVEVREIS